LSNLGSLSLFYIGIFMNELKNVGKKVSRLRKAYGMSINALSRVSGVSSRTISRVEELGDPSWDNYTYTPKLDTVHNLANAFGLSTGIFLGSKVKEVVHASPGLCV
jgi:transcriptional regulator with XRE-family HTH domain